MPFTELTTLQESASGTTHTLTIPVGKSVAIGELMVLAVGMTSASTTYGTPTDTGGNTWVAGSTINTSNPSLGFKSAVFCCVATVALVAGNQVQFTTSASTRGAGYLISMPGPSGTSATVRDVAATKSSAATGTAVTAGPTATTAGADFVVGVAAYSSAGTVTAGAGYTISTTDHVASNNGLDFTLVFKLASGAAAETAALTLAATSGWQAIVETFKMASGTVDTFTLATTGGSAPVFTLAGMTDLLVLAAAGVSAPVFTLAGMLDGFSVAATGTSTPGFNVSAQAGSQVVNRTMIGAGV